SSKDGEMETPRSSGVNSPPNAHT
ncbi:hypothetical protein Tco_0182731, partial [Tanacetum coccineum]